MRLCEKAEVDQLTVHVLDRWPASLSQRLEPCAITSFPLG